MTMHEPVVPVDHLDTIFAEMALICLAHAVFADKAARAYRLQLWVAALLVGVAVETASIHLGGTHCHASGIVNLSVCSSGNSVVWYISWIYAAVVAGQRLTEGRRHLLPWTVGAFMFLLCGPYEMQGPTLKWWRWPDASGVVAPGADLWQLEKDPRGLVAVPNTQWALQERWHGFPVVAPFFHLAMGWGIGACLYLFNNSLLAVIFLSPAFAMLWDPPLRLLEAFGVTKLGAVPVLMALALTVPFVISTSPLKAPANLRTLDYILMLVPIACHPYFMSIGAIFPGTVPPNLQLVAGSIAFCGLIAFAKASGFFGWPGTSTAASSSKKAKRS